MNRIDSHHHFWQLGRFAYTWLNTDRPALQHDFLPSDLRPVLDALGVAQSVSVQADQSVAETYWLLELAERYPWIAGVVGWLDLSDPNVAATIHDLATNPRLKGIRSSCLVESDGHWQVRENARPGLAEIARRGLVYDVNFRTPQFQALLAIAAEWPDLTIVLEHVGKPAIASGVSESWIRGIDEVARIPNLYCKLSGMVTVADHVHWTWQDFLPYVDHVVDCFGPERLLFGSDWPVCLEAASYERAFTAVQRCLEAIGVDTLGQDRIFGETAATVYKL